MTPHALDLAIGAIILLSTLIAYFRGIVREFFTLAGFALASFISYKGGHLLVPGLGKWLGVPPEGSNEKVDLVLGLVSPTVASYIIAYGGVFLLVFILMIVLRVMATRWIKEAGLSVVDRLLGAGFGFLRGFILVFVVYTTCYYLISKDKFPEWVKNSHSAPIFEGTLAWTKTHIDLDKMIEDRGNGIAIKLDKVDLDKAGAETGEAAKELKAEVKKEETEIQKAIPETPPAPLPSAPPAPVVVPQAPAAVQPPVQPPAPPVAPPAPAVVQPAPAPVVVQPPAAPVPAAPVTPGTTPPAQ